MWRYEIQISMSIRFYWDKAMYICLLLSGAAFVPQWQSWVVVTDTYGLQSLKYPLALYGKKFANL